MLTRFRREVNLDENRYIAYMDADPARSVKNYRKSINIKRRYVPDHQDRALKLSETKWSEIIEMIIF